MTAFACLFCCVALSAPLKSQYIQVPFAQLKKILIIEIPPADQAWLGSCSLRLLKKNIKYEIIGTSFPNEPATRIELVENFVFPETIEQEMHSMKFEKLPIRTSSEKWGKTYSWETPSAGSATYSYFCPSKAKHCIRTLKAGMSQLKFSLRSM